MVTAGILPFRENSHGRTGNRTRDLMINSQRLWPLDHEAGLSAMCLKGYEEKRWSQYGDATPLFMTTEFSRSHIVCSCLWGFRKDVSVLNRHQSIYGTAHHYTQHDTFSGLQFGRCSGNWMPYRFAGSHRCHGRLFFTHIQDWRITAK